MSCQLCKGIEPIFFQAADDCLDQAKGAGFSGRPAGAPAGRQSGGFQPSLDAGHEPIIGKANRDFIGPIPTSVSSKAIADRLNLFIGAVDNTHMLHLKWNGQIEPRFAAEASMLVETLFPLRLGADEDQSGDSVTSLVTDLIEHFPCGLVHIDRRTQDDILFQMTFAEFNRLEARGLAVPQFALIEQVEVVQLKLCEKFPSLPLVRSAEIAHKFRDMDKIEAVTGQFDMLSAERIAQFPPTDIIIGRGGAGDQPGQSLGCGLAQHLAPGESLGEFPCEGPFGRVELFGQRTHRFDHGRHEFQAGARGRLDEQFEQSAASSSPRENNDHIRQVQPPPRAVSLDEIISHSLQGETVPVEKESVHHAD